MAKKKGANIQETASEEKGAPRQKKFIRAQVSRGGRWGANQSQALRPKRKKAHQHGAVSDYVVGLGPFDHWSLLVQGKLTL